MQSASPRRHLLRAPEAWRVVSKDPFQSHGNIQFARDANEHGPTLQISRGKPGSGVNYRGPVPRMNYAISAEARRTEGDDFFYGLTFPINDQHASLIVGGWGGGVWGVSNLDGLSAVENETTGYREFTLGQWYKIVLRVTPSRVTVDLDDENIIDFGTQEHQYSVWPEQATMIPLGIATWKTSAEVRQLTLERVGG